MSPPVVVPSTLRAPTSTMVEEALRWREADEAIKMVEEHLQTEAEDSMREVAEADEMRRLEYCESLALNI